MGSKGQCALDKPGTNPETAPCLIVGRMELEPQSLVRSFIAHPPKGFSADLSRTGLPMFVTAYDLLTTVDAKLRAAVEKLPLHRYWRRWHTPRVTFIGTTVTEYAQFPAGIDAFELVRDMLTRRGHHPLLIVKDLPAASPLLDQAANERAEAVKRECERAGFTLIAGQALAYVPIEFSHPDEYLAMRSAGRRKDLRRKLKSLQQLRITTVPTGEKFDDVALRGELYALYLSVYAQSEVHFDLLTPEFFSAILADADNGGVVFMYHRGEELVGFNLCFVCRDKLIDKFIGLRYPQARELNLYFVSWMHNLEYALHAGLKFYVAGWTDPQVKRDLGASFTWTVHAVYARNPMLRWALRRLHRIFEADARWHTELDSAARAGT